MVLRRPGEAGNVEVSGMLVALLHGRRRLAVETPSAALEPVTDPRCCLQYDQCHDKAGYGSPRRAGDDWQAGRGRTSDRRALRNARDRLDDPASDTDLCRRPRYQHYPLVAAHPPVWFHAVG